VNSHPYMICVVATLQKNWAGVTDLTNQQWLFSSENVEFITEKLGSCWPEKIQRQNQPINNRWTNKNGAINQLNNQSINSKWICNQQKLRDWVAAGNSETQTISMRTMTAQMNLEGEGHPEKKFQALDSYLKFLMHLKHSHRYSIAFTCSLN